MSKRLSLLVGLAVLLVGLGTQDAIAAEKFSGPVTDITDGDTIKVLSQGETFKIRLAGIDAPERRQPYSDRAKRFASQLAIGQVVTVHYSQRDRWGRILGEVVLPDGRSLNQEMVRAGLAWHYKKGSKDRELARLERRARAQHLGLWRDRKPEAPWEYRARERRADN
jgi:endonuclease YncB( thermonuclease family)